MEKLTANVKQLALDLGADFAFMASARPFQTPEENLPGKEGDAYGGAAGV